ncbi:solute carrier family 13 member 4 isoform 3-T3 [Syngnathus typhle]
MRLEAAARMDLLRKLWRARNLIVVVFIPLFLLPLPLIHPTSEASCAYVLIVTAVYWVSEAVPLGAAALVPAFLYPLFGVLKSSEVAAEYSKDTTLLLMGVICLAASIEKWNLHKRIALRMVMVAGAKPGMLVLGFMCCTVFLSMWLSNTSTTAMVMPIAEAVLQQLICTGMADNLEPDAAEDESDKDENPDKNQLALLYRNDGSNNCNKQEVSTLSEVQTGEPNGVNPNTNQDRITHPNGHLPQVAVEIPNVKRVKARRDSQYPTKRDHMICKCLTLSITYAATIGGLITITGTSTNLIFAEQFNTRYPDAKVINFGTWFIFSFPIAIIMLVLTWLWLHFLFLGCNFRETCSLSKKRKSKREMMSEKRIHEEYEKLGPISYPEVVTGVFFILMTLLWFTREPGFVPGWTSLFEKKGYRTDATVSVLLGFLLFLIPAKRPFSSPSSSYRNSGLSEAHAVGDRHPGGRRLRASRRLQGVRLVGVDRSPAGAHERTPALGRHPARLPAGVGGHRVRLQPGDAHRLPAYPLRTVRDLAHQPPAHFNPLHYVRVIRGHASCGESSQRHRLQLRTPADQRHGESRFRGEPDRRCRGDVGYHYVGGSPF